MTGVRELDEAEECVHANVVVVEVDLSEAFLGAGGCDSGGVVTGDSAVYDEFLFFGTREDGNGVAVIVPKVASALAKWQCIQ